MPSRLSFCLVALASACQFEPPAVPLPCMADQFYQANPDTGRLYRAFDQEVLFDTARERCEADGAHLAVIDDEEENKYVFEQLGRDVWIGLTDEQNEGTFVWLTGEELEYKNWNEGEPNDARGGEDYTELVNDGVWNDIGPDDPNRFICECKLP